MKKLGHLEKINNEWIVKYSDLHSAGSGHHFIEISIEANEEYKDDDIIYFDENIIGYNDDMSPIRKASNVQIITVDFLKKII
jgi:hypothetical protein